MGGNTGSSGNGSSGNGSSGNGGSGSNGNGQSSGSESSSGGNSSMGLLIGLIVLFVVGGLGVFIYFKIRAKGVNKVLNTASQFAQ